MTRMSVRVARMIRRTVLAASVVTLASACESAKPSSDVRLWTEHYTIRLSSVPTPPVAEGVTEFKIVVQDKETGQPIETGEGRIFGSTPDMVQSYDGLAKGKEVGTYYARLRFPIAGEWAMGLQFRRDPNAPLERTNDWAQSVRAAPPLGTSTPTVDTAARDTSSTH